MHGSEESVDSHTMTLTLWFYAAAVLASVVFVSVFMTSILEAFLVGCPNNRFRDAVI
ncbi:hypothetical protein BDR05DRAFT_965438 [Suillus weaverae]|nr:hypothetical protein BDR05DRAFT_965438 [Suillus weaverae]